MKRYLVTVDTAKEWEYATYIGLVGIFDSLEKAAEAECRVRNKWLGLRPDAISIHEVESDRVYDSFETSFGSLFPEISLGGYSE